MSVALKMHNREATEINGSTSMSGGITSGEGGIEMVYFWQTGQIE